MSQDLHLKASGFLAEGSSFLANICTVRCEKVPRNRKVNSLKSIYKSQEHGKEKTELRTYARPTVYCLV